MATEDACKLFVAGLPDSVTEDVLREIFEAVGGTVVDVSLPRDRATGRPRGFGFVTFSTAEEASNARQSLDGSLQAGRSISVRPFSSEPPRRGETRTSEGAGGGSASTEDRTLYVGNLPYDASQQEVIQFLGEHGVTQIARVHLPSGPDGRPRGFGFVTLQSADAANQAIISLRGVEVRGRRLLVNIAHPRGASPGGGAGGRGMGGPRPPREEGGGWSGGGGGGGYAPPPPDAPPGSRPEGRRRGAGGPTEGGEEGDARRKNKKRTAGKGRGGPPERGGGGNWRSWNRDDDD
jgi:RNA recognition motif-containing protein